MPYRDGYRKICRNTHFLLPDNAVIKPVKSQHVQFYNNYLWYQRTSCPGKFKIRSLVKSSSDSSKCISSLFELKKQIKPKIETVNIKIKTVIKLALIIISKSYYQEIIKIFTYTGTNQ